MLVPNTMIDWTVFRRRTALIGGGLVVFALAGAWIDWRLWADEGGIVLTLVAVPLALIGVVLALIAHGRIRLAATAAAVAGVGLLAGQALGPSREPLTLQDGTMTIHLTAPVVGTATGSAYCRNVASGTEFAVNGDSNMLLETADRPFLTAYINVGDRWAVRDEAPRTNGVRLDVSLSGRLVPDSGKPLTTTMVAGPTSTIQSTFSNTGGSLQFADLIPETGPDSSGESVALAGTIEWTCGGESG